MFAPLRHWPMGLGGLMATTTFRDQEDLVMKLINEHEEGLLALLYKSLYARGYRIDTCDAQIAKMRKKLEP